MSVVMGRKAIVGIVLLILVIAGAAAGYYYYYIPSTMPLVPNRNTLTVQSFGDADKLDPAVDYETFGGMIIENTYEGLIAYKGSSMTDFEPALATSWTVSPDGLVYTFKLRQNVKFHDGTDFDATDVVATYNMGLNIGSKFHAGNTNLWEYYDYLWGLMKNPSS